MMGDINSAMGAEVLQREHVQHAYAGIYPLIDDVINPNVYQGTGDYQIIDHAKSDNLDGLVSVFGAKYTTARLLAEKALDKIAPRFNKTLDQCKPAALDWFQAILMIYSRSGWNNASVMGENLHGR